MRRGDVHLLSRSKACVRVLSYPFLDAPSCLYASASSLLSCRIAFATESKSAPPPSCAQSESCTSAGSSSLLRNEKDRFSPVKYVSHHTRLLLSILSSGESTSKRCRRVKGVLAKLEEDASHWLLVSPTASPVVPRHVYAELLRSLALCCRTLGGRGRFLSASKEDGDEHDVNSNELRFTTRFKDLLSICANLALESNDSNKRVLTPKERLHFLSVLIELQLEGECVSKLLQEATSTAMIREASTEEQIQTLRIVSLAVKRCEVIPPPLLCLLGHITTATQLSPNDVLQILSSLVRLRLPYDGEVTRRVSLLGATHPANYNSRELIFSLTAISFLTDVDPLYATKVLQRVSELCPSLSPSYIGDVSKYIGLLNETRKRNALAKQCEAEIRRAVYAIVDRAQDLLHQFSVRDARYVVRCLKQHNVRHSLVFASLVPRAMGAVE